MSSNFRPRIIIVSFLFCLIAGLLVTRLFYLQVLNGKEFNKEVTGTASTPDIAKFERGTIYMKKKDGSTVSGASTVSGYIVVLDKELAGDSDKVINQLADIVTLEKDKIIKKVKSSSSRYIEVAYKVTQSQADELNKKKITGIALRQSKWRFYPGSALAARTIGFVAFKGDDLRGRYGLERYYDDLLTLNPQNLYTNFFTEVFANLHETVFHDTTSHGDLVTSIEPKIQQYLDQTLESVVKKYNADGAGGIVMDPKTGAIYAMTQLPLFDLNDFSKVSDPALYNNPNVENVFEFGSVMKPLVMAAALDTGAVTAETTYIDKGELTLNTETIHNFDKQGRGKATMQDVLTQSLNTGMVFAEQKMGRDSFKKYMLAYGIGEKTGVDLPNETSGLITNLNSKREIEYATAAFGQGIAVTPVEAVRAFASLANGGNLVTPHFGTELHLQSGAVEPIEYNLGAQVIKPETSEEITRMLVSVVDHGIGEGKYKNPHYSIAAKTGTAQIADPKGGYADKYLHSLFGYYPAYNPKFLVLVYMIDPKGVRYAATTMADPFFDLSKYLLSYYEVPPDR